MLNELFVQRFRIEAIAGSGGMGTVYRARDVLSDQMVALKLMHPSTRPEDTERFAREARMLSSLRHPGIVACVGFGVAEKGEPYVAMEWLEGEDLAQLLSRRRLQIDECVTLLHRIADALRAAHEQNIVHRDIKPSNLFLRHGKIDQVTLLDFGLAKIAALVSGAVTKSGLIVGSPEYMAPEQARGQGGVGPAADIFSLGCVLYECLSGKPPFAAGHLAAVLAKILFEAPLPIKQLRPDIPQALASLIDRMLVKEPSRRISNAIELVNALEGFQSAPAASEHIGLSSRRAFTGEEQQLLSVIIATPSQKLDKTIELGSNSFVDPILQGTVEEFVRLFGAQPEWTADGSLIVTLSKRYGEARDRADNAARCALAIRDQWPNALIVLATGRGQLGSRLPMGEVLERAGHLLRSAAESARVHTTEKILLDRITAGLLSERWQLEEDSESAAILLGGRSDEDESRPLLGKPTPCVGREQELGVLESALSSCIEESEPHFLLVAAPAGMGKSRLRHEFLRRLSNLDTNPVVLAAHGDAMLRGSPYGMIAAMLKKLCGIEPGDSIEEQRQKLKERVSRHLRPPSAGVHPAIVFLGEICGIPFSDEANLKLRAARADARIMGDQIAQALLDFLRAECMGAPHIFVLEDLHLADVLTVKWIELAMRELRGVSLLVLAFGRPEVLDRFPALLRSWSEHRTMLSLRPLGKRARERLVRQILTAGISSELVERIVEQSGGNPLLLEELVRAAAKGYENLSSDTVVAMLQARIEKLERDERRVLLVASLFGINFSKNGLVALFSTLGEAEIETHLRALVEAETIESRPGSAPANDKNYRFHHSLIREAAYGLLVDTDRRLGHRLVSEYLQRIGETNPVVLAEHLLRSDEPGHAVPFLLNAARNALRSNDLDIAIRYAYQGIQCGASGAELAELYCIRSTAELWHGDLNPAYEAGKEALRLLMPGSSLWCEAALSMVFVTTYLNLEEAFSGLVEQFEQIEPQRDAIGSYVEAASFLVILASLNGRAERARFFLHKLRAMDTEEAALEAGPRGWIRYAHSVYCHWIENDQWLKRELSLETIQLSRITGDRRMEGMGLVSLGIACAGLGAYPEAYRAFYDAFELSKKLPHENFLYSSVRTFLAQTLVEEGDSKRFEEAFIWAGECIAASKTTSPMVGRAHWVLARVLSFRGELLKALEHAKTAVAALRIEAAVCPSAFAELTRILLRLDRVQEAREVAEDGLSVLDRVGRSCMEVDLLMAVSEARMACGDRELGEAALDEAWRRMQASAMKIPDIEARKRYFTVIPLHARVVERAQIELMETVDSCPEFGDTIESIG